MAKDECATLAQARGYHAQVGMPMESSVHATGFSLEDLLERIDRVWRVEQSSTREAALASEGRSLASKVIAIGDQASQTLNEAALTDENRAALLSTVFEWPEGAKRFLMLWRDVLLEWERATVLLAEKRASSADLAKLAAQSQATLRTSAEEWLTSSERRTRNLRTDPELRSRELYNWSLQNSPWPIYRGQLEQLREQLALLHDDFSVRLASAKTLLKLQYELLSPGPYFKQQIEELEARAQEAVAKIEGNDAIRLSDQELERLDQLDPVGLLNGFVTDLTQQSNEIIDELPEQVKLFVRSGGGAMQYRDVELERQTGQWVSAEVIPLLQRADRSLNQITIDLSRTLKEVVSKVRIAAEDIELQVDPKPNLSEQLQSEKNEVQSETQFALHQPLEAYVERLHKVASAIEADIASAEKKVEDQLRLSRVYEPDASFLEVSFEAGMSKVLLSQDALLNRFVDWLTVQRKRFRKLRHRVSQEEALSEGERIVRVLRTRRPDPRNASYNSVMVTRGFIGEAFHAGREYELARAQEAIAAFDEGFRGAILISGQRFSGRSHFAELLASRFFEQRTIRLRPQTTIEVAGRTMSTTHDLAAALAFVRKHSVGERPLILIDDLELWADAQFTLAAGARALVRAIDELSSRVMFVVTAGNWTVERMERVLDVDRSFQVEINMDDFLMEDFQQTALVRHAATHHTLLGQDGNPMSERSMRDFAEDAYRSAKGNVGDGLLAWISALERQGVGEVKLTGCPRYALPNFINSDTGVVLSALKRRRYANEYTLRKVFGPAFDERYRSVLMRLQRIGILKRHHTGTLSITPSVSNEIGRLLGREGYLRSSFARKPIQL